METMWSLSH